MIGLAVDGSRLFDDPAANHPSLPDVFARVTGFLRSRPLSTVTTGFGSVLNEIHRGCHRGPVVLRNFAADWPALGKWDREYLLSRYASQHVNAAIGWPDHGVPFLISERSLRRAMTLREFWDEMDRAGRCYLEQQVLSAWPGLEHDLRMPDLFGSDARLEPNLWLGRGTKSGIHFDPADNFFLMIRGHKLVAMAAPHEIVRLYPFLDSVMKSQVALERPDFARFPRAAEVEMHVARLAAGDLLYIPKGWWHYVSSAADQYHISVNCWFGEELPWSSMAANLLRLGPRYVARLAADFVVRGMLGRPFVERFHSLPDGVKLYRRLRGGRLPDARDTMLPADRARTSAKVDTVVVDHSEGAAA